MGFFSSGNNNKQLAKAVESMIGYGNSALGNINTGYDAASGRYGALQSDLRPGWGQFLDYVQGGGGLGGLRDIQSQMMGYRGPDLANDPYLQYMNDSTARNLRMAQAARGVIRSSAGIGQEERALAANQADAFRYGWDRDMNQMLQGFNMLGNIENTRYGQLAGLGGMYTGTVDALAGLDVNRANSLAGINQWLGGGVAGLQSQMKPKGSFLDKFNQVTGSLGGLFDTVGKGVSAVTGLGGLTNLPANLSAQKNILQGITPEYVESMLRGGGGLGGGMAGMPFSFGMGRIS